MDPRRINQFITCISSLPCTFSLANAGSIVQKVTLKHKPRHFLYTHDFTNTNVFQLVNACPNLEAIDCADCEQAQVIMDGLLFTHVTVNLKQLPNIASELEQYKNCAYRFRSSLTTLTLPSNHQRLDLGFLTGFPMLSQLDLGKNEVTSISYLDALLNACPTLQELTFQFGKIQSDDTSQEATTAIEMTNDGVFIIPTITTNNSNDNSSIVSTRSFTKEIYPTLKHLFVTTTQDKIPQILVDYILYRFTKLITLDMEGVDIIDTTLEMNTSFEALIKYMDNMESCSLRLRGNDYNLTTEVAQAYLSGLSEAVNKHRITNIKIHNNPKHSIAFVSYWTGVIGVQKRRHFQIRLPDFETANQELQLQYVKQFSDFVNELSIDYQGTIVYKYALTQLYDLILQHCLHLKTLKINYAELDISQHDKLQNHAVTRLHLSNSHIPQECFRQLSHHLPNLKHLVLNRNFHIDDPRCIRIDMRYSSLEHLALLGESYFPWISTLSQQTQPIEEVILLVAQHTRPTRYYYATVLSIHAVEADEAFAQSVISRRRAMAIYISAKEIKSLVLGTATTNTHIDIE
jgi:Leucine-rich repeat (LRR) protein